jgi:hypothetical protein
MSLVLKFPRQGMVSDVSEEIMARVTCCYGHHFTAEEMGRRKQEVFDPLKPQTQVFVAHPPSGFSLDTPTETALGQCGSQLSLLPVLGRVGSPWLGLGEDF